MSVSKISAFVEVKEWSKTNLTDITPFAYSVYTYVKRIPAGKVVTYKMVAEAIDSPYASRAVGTALKKNPFAPIVPCHRVINSDFTVGGFMGKTESNIKCEMLQSEGICIVNGKIINDTAYRASILYVPKFKVAELVIED